MGLAAPPARAYDGGMEQRQGRRALLRRLAWAGVALVLAITTLSAFIRLSRAGAGCEPWPQCHIARRDVPVAQLALQDSHAVGTARLAHRIVASSALLLFIVLLVLLHMTAGTPRSPGRLALAIVALAIFLAVLGAAAGPSQSAAVVMGNLLAGFAMFALALRLALSLRDAPRPPTSPAQRVATASVLLLVVAQGSLGAALAASHEAARCGESLLCNAHRGIGIVTIFAAAAAALVARGAGGAMATALVPLAIVQGALGLALLHWGVPLPLAVTHNAVAAVLAATLVALLPGRAR